MPRLKPDFDLGGPIFPQSFLYLCSQKRILFSNYNWGVKTQSWMLFSQLELCCSRKQKMQSGWETRLLRTLAVNPNVAHSKRGQTPFVLLLLLKISLGIFSKRHLRLTQFDSQKITHIFLLNIWRHFCQPTIKARIPCFCKCSQHELNRQIAVFIKSIFFFPCSHVVPVQHSTC